MRSRFIKVWCPTCCTMQFAGECGHGRIIEPHAGLVVPTDRARRLVGDLLNIIAPVQKPLTKQELAAIDKLWTIAWHDKTYICSPHGVRHCPPCWRGYLAKHVARHGTSELTE